MNWRILIAKLNLFSMFKKEHIYGKTLLYLYKNPSGRFSENDIRKHIMVVPDTYFADIISWLLKDKLIVEEKIKVTDYDPPNTVFSFYRISYHGFSFIKDLKEKRNNRIINSISIGIACLSIAFTSWANYTNKNYISKVDIVKLPYLNMIKHDTAPPIAKPCAIPIITAGKSSLSQGKQK